MGCLKSLAHNGRAPLWADTSCLPRAPSRVTLLHMSPLSRRLAKIEARRPAQGPAQMIDANLLYPEVLALWLAVDIDQMNLDQLDLLEDNLRRLPV